MVPYNNAGIPSSAISIYRLGLGEILTLDHVFAELWTRMTCSSGSSTNSSNLTFLLRFLTHSQIIPDLKFCYTAHIVAFRWSEPFLLLPSLSHTAMPLKLLLHNWNTGRDYGVGLCLFYTQLQVLIMPCLFFWSLAYVQPVKMLLYKKGCQRQARTGTKVPEKGYILTWPFLLEPPRLHSGKRRCSFVLMGCNIFLILFVKEIIWNTE